MSTPYDDLLHMSRHVSEVHAPMPRADRAAQFSPFAALTGYEAAVEETARLTDSRIELDEGGKELIDQKLSLIQDSLPQSLRVTLTYFVPDKKKSGGAYISVSGGVKKIDEYERQIIMTDGSSIAIDDILTVEGELFSGLESLG